MGTRSSTADKKSAQVTCFDEVTRSRLRKLIALLGSNQDGEILGAVAGIQRVLSNSKSDFHSLAALLTASPAAPQTEKPPKRPPEPEPPEPEPWRETVLTLLRTHAECGLCLNAWDRQFLSNLAGYYTKKPSASQLDILDQIELKAGRLHHAA